MHNINDSYFDGEYKNVWRNLIPEGLTKAEVEFLIGQAELVAGNKVLDLMCGYGRHALALARKGMLVTAVDNLADYTGEIKDIAGKEDLPVEVLQTDVIELRPSGRYNLVICLGNCLSFFNLDESAMLFSIVSSSLNPGSKFIFNSWTIAEIAIKEFSSKKWSYVGETKYLVDCQYLFSPTRIETESIFITPDGKTEIKNGIDYIYSFSEMEAMLKQSGLRIKDTWSIPGRKKFSLGDPRIYVVAEKI